MYLADIVLQFLSNHIFAVIRDTQNALYHKSLIIRHIVFKSDFFYAWLTISPDLYTLFLELSLQAHTKHYDVM